MADDIRKRNAKELQKKWKLFLKEQKKNGRNRKDQKNN